jgi:hypothetical protein
LAAISAVAAERELAGDVIEKVSIDKIWGKGKVLLSII